MSLPCKIIEDMLPMYCDKVCSEESAAFVEAHLKECPHCSQMLADLRYDIGIPEPKIDDSKPLRKLQKRYKKMRLGWLIAAIAVLLLIPVAFIIGNRNGKQPAPVIEYTKEEATACANAFMTCLVEKDYEAAFSYWDIAGEKADLADGNLFAEEYFNNFETDGLRKFCEGGDKLEQWGGIQSFQLIGISEPQYANAQATEDYSVSYRILFDGKEERFTVRLTKNGIHRISSGDGLVRHPLSHLTLWVQWVVDDYTGKYYDFDAGQWVDITPAE